MSNIPNIAGYGKLVSVIESLLQDAKSKLVKTVNQTMVFTYWHIGRYIVEYEQRGKERAEYGTELLKRLSIDLSRSFGKGYSWRNLYNMKQFYVCFPILQALTAKSENSNMSSLMAQSESDKGQSLFALSEKQKGQTLSANSKDSKLQTLSAKSELSKVQLVIAKLSWTHFVRLLRVKDADERNFYLIETAENNWSVRELDRQINSSLFERLLLSKDKPAVKKLAEKGQIIEHIDDVLKEPYILEFLGLEESHRYSESDLESAIIDNLGKFLLELGKGFLFVARQKRFSDGTDYYYIDLVFYNRLLKCFVLFDLKIGKITHKDIGQMQMYVNYYDREIKTTEENPTAGIILCKEKRDFVIKYTLPENNKQIFAKEYRLFLPQKEELKKLLRKFL